jgi:hypothetical protein
MLQGRSYTDSAWRLAEVGTVFAWFEFFQLPEATSPGAAVSEFLHAVRIDYFYSREAEVFVIEEREHVTCEQYQGLVWKFARKYWPRLPTSTQSFYDLDDMVGDLNVHVIWALRERYDPARGTQQTTFLYWCLQNYCRSFVSSCYAQKRVGFPVEATEVFPTLVCPDMERRRVEVVAAMERLLEDASDELRYTFSDWLWEGSRSISTACAEEMRRLCRCHSVDVQDLRLVLSII